MKTLFIVIVLALTLASCQKDEPVTPNLNTSTQLIVDAYGTGEFNLGWRTSAMEDGFWNKQVETDKSTIIVALQVGDTLEVGSYGNRLVVYDATHSVQLFDLTFDGYAHLKVPN